MSKASPGAGPVFDEGFRHQFEELSLGAATSAISKPTHWRRNWSMSLFA